MTVLHQSTNFKRRNNVNLEAKSQLQWVAKWRTAAICALNSLAHLPTKTRPLPFQVNLQRKMRLTGIVTQGASRVGTAEFVKAFKVASSLDGKTYTVYRTEDQSKDQVR